MDAIFVATYSEAWVPWGFSLKHGLMELVVGSPNQTHSERVGAKLVELIVFPPETNSNSAFTVNLKNSAKSWLQVSLVSNLSFGSCFA